MGIFWQVVCAIAVSYACLNMGIIFTWPSSTVELFASENTTLSRPMTMSETALFGSLTSIGALVSTPLLGIALDVIGRKYSIILISLTHVICWTLISSSSQVEVVLTGVFIAGLGGSIFFVAPLYMAEFCQENIRGALTAGSILFYSFGMLISYMIGQFCTYKIMVYTCLTLAVIGVAVLMVMKESPVFLMNKGLEEEAAKSIAFYRGCNVKSKIVMDELDVLRRALNPEMDDDGPETEKLKPSNIIVQPKLNIFQFIKNSKATRHAFIIGLTLISLSISQGLVVVQVYADPLFKAAVPEISSKLCCIILAAVTLLSGVCTAYLTDRAGRRMLMIGASIGCGICCLLLGSQIHLDWAPQMFTVIIINVFCFVYCLGPGTIPFVFLAEVFLPEVRSKLNSVLLEVAWVFNFLVLYSYNPLIEVMGLGPLFYLYAIIAFITALFSYIYQPETKGLTMDAIQGLFDKKGKKKKNVVV